MRVPNAELLPRNHGNREPGYICITWNFCAFVILCYGPRVGNLGLVVFYETSICNIINVGKEKIFFLLPG